jgi:hypothetical protein
MQVSDSFMQYTSFTHLCPMGFQFSGSKFDEQSTVNGDELAAVDL